ncbi:recombinase RecO [Spirochaetia bacterium]|nr:recombinase RecO [Spirochaetia bacterium]
MGEANREVTFLTAEEGLLRATVFGGPKSKLRAYAAPYHQGTLWLYHDPVKDYRKVTDFDVQIWRPGLRELYDRSMAASAVAETILAAHGGGGNWKDALTLAAGALDALNTTDEHTSRRIVIHFLWNWADILGARPEMETCASCGKRLVVNSGSAGSSPANNNPFAAEAVWYSKREGSVLCPACAGLSAEELPTLSPDFAADYLPLSPGTRRWLAAVQELKASLLTRLIPDKTAEREAKALTTAILSDALGKRLATWDW